MLATSRPLDGQSAARSVQFFVARPRLPPGAYELTLRSRLPDGTLATSKQGVVVALTEAESSSGVNRSRAEVPFSVPETAATDRLSLDRAIRSSQARLLSQPPLHIAKRQAVAVSELPRATAGARLFDGGSSSPVVEPKITTTVVSR